MPDGEHAGSARSVTVTGFWVRYGPVQVGLHKWKLIPRIYMQRPENDSPDLGTWNLA
jgi:hypothetical protein